MKSETITLGDLTVCIDEKARTLTSKWPDGTELVAAPNYDLESIERAEALGYEGFSLGIQGEQEAVWQMTRDHDLFHHVVAQAEGEPWSWHLYYVAGGEMAVHDVSVALNGDREERLVFLLQRMTNVGRQGLLS